jgi:hypothetical protein
MKQYFLGMHKPTELLEKIYLNLFSSEEKEDKTTFGVTHDILYGSNTMQFGAVIDKGGLTGIANRVKEAFRQEGFSEIEELHNANPQAVRVGMQKESDLYVTRVSLSPYNPSFPFFNHTVDIRKMSS